MRITLFRVWRLSCFFVFSFSYSQTPVLDPDNDILELTQQILGIRGLLIVAILILFLPYLFKFVEIFFARNDPKTKLERIKLSLEIEKMRYELSKFSNTQKDKVSDIKKLHSEGSEVVQGSLLDSGLLEDEDQSKKLQGLHEVYPLTEDELGEEVIELIKSMSMTDEVFSRLDELQQDLKKEEKLPFNSFYFLSRLIFIFLVSLPLFFFALGGFLNYSFRDQVWVVLIHFLLIGAAWHAAYSVDMSPLKSVFSRFMTFLILPCFLGFISGVAMWGLSQ